MNASEQQFVHPSDCWRDPYTSKDLAILEVWRCVPRQSRSADLATAAIPKSVHTPG